MRACISIALGIVGFVDIFFALETCRCPNERTCTWTMSDCWRCEGETRDILVCLPSVSNNYICINIVALATECVHWNEINRDILTPICYEESRHSRTLRIIACRRCIAPFERTWKIIYFFPRFLYTDSHTNTTYASTHCAVWVCVGSMDGMCVCESVKTIQGKRSYENRSAVYF